MMRNLHFVSSLKSLLFLALLVSAASPAQAQDRPPNVLIILADDLGYADLGCYGGDIRTPNLDALAADGLRFTNFYNTARCWTSRVSLMTGYYHDQLGRLGRGQGRGAPSWARTLPQMLEPAGYRSYHSGKWHLDRWFSLPLADGGFDRSYFINNHGFYRLPTWYLDDQPQPAIGPDEGHYVTTSIAEHMIGFLQEHDEQHGDQPFFAYLAFTAPHFPLHAEQEDIDRYADQYADGWDARRRRIFERQLEMGIVHPPLSALEPQIRAPSGNAQQLAQFGPGEIAFAVDWDELTQEQQAFQSMKMRLHAAMVDRMDQEIGRVLDQLRAMDAFDNTLIVFLSDNGASAEIMVRGDGHNPESRPGAWDTYYCLGPGWSSSSNTPFRRHKIWTHEGGIATPAIFHWPNAIRTTGELRHTPTHLIDLVPTIRAMAGLRPDDAPVEGGPNLPGMDLVWCMMDIGDVFVHPPADGVIPRHSPLFFNHAGNRALIVSNWKIVSSRIDNDVWALYDLSVDRAEQHDLSAEHPERVREMVAQWERMHAQFAEDAAR